MVKTHNLGFPRIGTRRQLKSALESYWQGQCTLEDLCNVGAQLRQQNWALQTGLDWSPVGDFSLYDHVLDMSFTLGNLPQRAQNFTGQALDNYFRLARGRSSPSLGSQDLAAGSMTKWFDSNYHYIVPEFTRNSTFHLDASRLVSEYEQAKSLNIAAKPVLLGPLSYLYLGQSKDGVDVLSLLPRLLPVYSQLLEKLAHHGASWVQIDEPILACDLNEAWQHALNVVYHHFKSIPVQVLLSTYFGSLGDNLYLAAHLPVAGLHVDAVRAREDVRPLLNLLPSHKVLSLGVIDGRNVWKNDLDQTLAWLQPVAQHLEDRLWLAPSCSLMHVPVDLRIEQNLDPKIRSWLSFAVQKLGELRVLARAINEGTASVVAELEEQRAAVQSRRRSLDVYRSDVQAALNQWGNISAQRQSAYAQRVQIQASRLHLPVFPTTTIGSFPQTQHIRQTRRRYKAGEINKAQYQKAMREEIQHCIDEQHNLNLDVLVHGEAERNDMVEYFGEHLQGFAFTTHGWVQSYGSRCVKPPIIFGDVCRTAPITLEWAVYAQSLTHKPMKGMLTGPVTLLNWSFVRDDQSRELTCRQLALAIRAEVQDLERYGISIIQIDEPALREGMPLRKSEQTHYLQWAANCFRVAANGVSDETQIHTHMCYSHFNDIMEHVARLDVDVVTIETARSNMKLLEVFERFAYPNAIGPGVYDVHAVQTPQVHDIMSLLLMAARLIPEQRLWVNPDCGLKTRQWSEVRPALANMVQAAHQLRQTYHATQKSKREAALAQYQVSPQR